MNPRRRRIARQRRKLRRVVAEFMDRVNAGVARSIMDALTGAS